MLPTLVEGKVQWAPKIEKLKSTNASGAVVVDEQVALRPDGRPVVFPIGVSLSWSDGSVTFFPFRSPTVSITRPPVPERYRSLSPTGEMLHPPKQSMSIPEFKRTHSPRWVALVLEEHNRVLDEFEAR